jgi:hypothetical protein
MQERAVAVRQAEMRRRDEERIYNMQVKAEINKAKSLDKRLISERKIENAKRVAEEMIQA